MPLTECGGSRHGSLWTLYGPGIRKPRHPEGPVMARQPVIAPSIGMIIMPACGNAMYDPERKSLMKWSAEAEAAIKKVPFFVRRKVRQRVESEASAAGRARVALADVKATQRRYLKGQADQIKGYQLDACFGPSGCPRRAVPVDDLLRRLEARLQAADLLSYLKKEVGKDLKFHHEFRLSLAECPNACSQPQIKDIGILGAAVPQVTAEACSGCGACIDACPDEAIHLDDAPRPVIDSGLCLACGQCTRACPTDTLAAGKMGYRIQLGGKLGRHPRLGRELPGIYSQDQVVAIVDRCLAHYKAHSKKGQRFTELVDDALINSLKAEFL
jgi:anaerobic sulfite reductase subunit C